MPVYLITLHAYRSWNADHKRGFVQRGKGIQPPNPALANEYSNNAKFPPVTFDERIQRLLVWGTHDICMLRSWRVYAVATETTHLHALISWTDLQVTWQDVRKRLKNVLSWMLGHYLEKQGGHWFVEDGSRRRVKDEAHFNYLMTEYLPRHSGLQWFNPSPPPAPPDDWVEPPKFDAGDGGERGKKKANDDEHPS